MLNRAKIIDHADYSVLFSDITSKDNESISIKNQYFLHQMSYFLLFTSLEQSANLMGYFFGHTLLKYKPYYYKMPQN